MALVLGRLPDLVWQHGGLCTHPERATPNEVIAAAVELVERLLEERRDRDDRARDLQALRDELEDLEEKLEDLQDELAELNRRLGRSR